MQKIIVIGATSGIGRGLAEIYTTEDCTVGIIGRREDLLKEIYSQNKEKIIYEVTDVTDVTTTIETLNSLCKKLQGLDVLIVSAGTGELNPNLEYHLEEPTIKTNVIGFTNIVDWGYNLFKKQCKGHIVTISSIGGIRGNSVAPAYNASKSYQMNYIEGLRQKAHKQHLPIYFTDVRPGFVDTAMAKGEGLFWVMPVNKAVNRIYRAIKKKRKIVYISTKWKFIALLLKIIPQSIYCKM